MKPGFRAEPAARAIGFCALATGVHAQAGVLVTLAEFESSGVELARHLGPGGVIPGGAADVERGAPTRFRPGQHAQELLAAAAGQSGSSRSMPDVRGDVLSLGELGLPRDSHLRVFNSSAGLDTITVVEDPGPGLHLGVVAFGVLAFVGFLVWRRSVRGSASA